MTIGINLRKEVIGVTTQMFVGVVMTNITAKMNSTTKLIIGVIVMETILDIHMVMTPRLRVRIRMLMKIGILRVVCV